MCSGVVGSSKDSDALRYFKNTKEASPIFLQFLEVRVNKTCAMQRL